MAPENVLFVGNDMFRDVYAAQQHGIKTVFFSSNQGSKQAEGVKPDYIIYQFPEMKQAVEFFERQSTSNRSVQAALEKKKKSLQRDH